MELQDSLQDDVGTEAVEELVAAPPRKLSRLRKAGEAPPPPPHENAQPNAALKESPEASEGGPEEAASPGGQRAEAGEDGEVRTGLGWTPSLLRARRTVQRCLLAEWVLRVGLQVDIDNEDGGGGEGYYDEEDEMEDYFGKRGGEGEEEEEEKGAASDGEGPAATEGASPAGSGPSRAASEGGVGTADLYGDTQRILRGEPAAPGCCRPREAGLFPFLPVAAPALRARA